MTQSILEKIPPGGFLEKQACDKCPNGYCWFLGIWADPVKRESWFLAERGDTAEETVREWYESGLRLKNRRLDYDEEGGQEGWAGE